MEEAAEVALAVLQFFHVKLLLEDVQFRLRSEPEEPVRVEDLILHSYGAPQEMHLLLLILFVQLVLQLVAAVEELMVEHVLQTVYLEVREAAEVVVDPTFVEVVVLPVKEMLEAMEKILLLLLMAVAAVAELAL
jgi:hypothetical protein